MKLRIARPTNDINQVLQFYRDGLGFVILAEFKDHAGFSGIMLGKKKCLYHFEFTIEANTQVVGAPTRENLLVFYFANESEWHAALTRMEKQGFKAVKSHNPYWDMHGKTFEDFEGYRTVLVNGEWED